MIVSHEASAYLRARDAAGLKLPAEVQARADRLADVEKQVDRLARLETAPTAAELASRGMDLTKAQAEADRLAHEQGKLAELHRIGRLAAEAARSQLNDAVVRHREELMLSLRPLMDALVDKARPHADTLAEFAPGYGAGDIVNRGDDKTLKAYQEAANLEREFGTLIAAWRSSFSDAKKAAHLFDYRWVAPVHQYFARPELVRNTALNGTKLNPRGYPVEIQPTILALASESPEVGFRLATIAELKAVFEEQRQAETQAVRGLGVRAL